jgi:plasmid stabilization system protein ParE
VIGYVFHPEASFDLDEIWDFIAEESVDAADRVISDIRASVEALVPFPRRAAI